MTGKLNLRAEGASIRRGAVAATLLLCLLAGRAVAAPSVASIESAYADLTDAYGALGLIDSGFAATYGGRSVAKSGRVHSKRSAPQ